MNEGMISKRYAKALLQYAVDQKAEDTVFSEMKTLASVFAVEPKMRMAMDNPTLNADDKLGLIGAAVGGKMSDTLSRFVELVLKNRREVFMRNIALSYIDLYCESKDMNMGRLVTATPVDSTVSEKMKGLLQKVKPGTLDFETEVDPSIEGGFILYVDTYRLDASVKTQLKRIKQQFVAENSKISK
ncbi:F-type H+-transporting ATPase subunit delta [Dysgonomonas sp. PFB1-18]|uniref:F0F1 ATP synthase subunit delta n=1 Tax=unclassified Dysgonomonas TaxID=2630389 RepID=UPI0024737D74|nr:MULTISPECIES: F0F1 ATP synthase subunit delta [unclassified Dysgonomonas]MDH6308527.1 F-type H+-transporting ATPase subunit delta [Dysgonomonas sp. PF1-14]MDH6338028.1 F-type H+-transporting ATPase subunit delta [Dysgonomonas sp. PF1-16]MDH6379525.1 F-type H+-transporting ATPase subunit delta [Dysgonomonas sp. PFB1-18]MDH6396855.1 F-type H+-transporting ATPase subunit delta [Dysgonomonas sp. PF1-23]